MKTSLKDWADNGWLRPHVPARGEIAGLFAIVDREDWEGARQGKPLTRIAPLE
jgi:hypothetical protein